MTDSTIADESRVSDEPAERLWSDGLILLLHIILPIAITGAIIGRKAIFARLWTHVDKSFLAVFCPSFSKREKLKKWMTDYLPHIDGGLAAMWKDGSLMCTLINSVVPGACPNPHRHWKKPPIHGQALAYKYLGVIPVFSETDFQSLKPTASQEKLLIDYVCNLQAAIEKLSPHTDVSFSSRYIARGMGLVTGEQHRKTDIYIYPNFNGHTHDDLLVNIRGPYNTYGSTTLKAIAFAQEKNAKLPDKRQSFLKSLSTDFSNLLKPKEKGPACDIEIKTEFEQERAKLVFVPNNSGVYEICLTTNGEHIAGSPFNLSIEKNRSGITQHLNDEDVKMRAEPKSIKKKVLNTVIYYEKLKTPAREDAKCENAEETCKISLQDVNFNTTVDDKIVGDKLEPKVAPEEKYTLPILETLEQLNNLLESTEKLEVQVQHKARDNFGLNIIDTMRSIPELKALETPVAEFGGVERNNEINEIATQEQTKTKDILTMSLNHDHICDYPQTFQTPIKSDSNLEDSGTYVNDNNDDNDIDPDSLSSSIEMQVSSEEISYSGGSGGSDSNENEVNNNNIMVKSNEDICYLILNQSTADRHKRIYSKDFISCKDEQSKDDLSKSDPNLHRDTDNSEGSNASALSHDNAQEAIQTTMSSRLFQQHPQEAQRIAAKRSHSYSHGSLLEHTETDNQEGREFKQHFLMKKAFWNNMSMSNMSLPENSKHRSCGKLDEADGRKLQLQHAVVRNLVKSDSVRSLELRSRSMDYVRQRRKLDTPTKDSARFGSADDLSFPSVRHRREQYLNEKKQQSSKPELYAVRGEKYSWSIHEKIKSFETGTTLSTPISSEKLQTLPENITVTNKIKQRFESAQTYFKRLESTVDDKRRHSLDGEGFASLQSTDVHRHTPKTKAMRERGNTVTGMQSLPAGNDPAIAADNELQHLFNVRRKRKHTRTPAVDIFN